MFVCVCVVCVCVCACARARARAGDACLFLRFWGVLAMGVLCPEIVKPRV